MPKGIYPHKKLSDTHKAKLSKFFKGRKREPMTPEQRKRMSEAHIGNRPTEESRKKMSESKKGRKSYNWKGGYENRLMLNRKRRVLKLGNGGAHTLGDWQLLKAQYNWTCPSCKKQEPEIKLSEDHIIPLTKGGSDNIENIQPLCRSCNSKKNNKIIKF